MPASGKTTLGRKLADRLAVPFIDLDEAVERKEGRSIPQLFEQEGEPYFRQAEASVLREVAGNTPDFVMATGGGAPCFYDGISFMNEVGTTVFLNVPVTELLTRLNQEGATSRPLFFGTANLEDSVKRLRHDRMKFYEQATYRVTDPDEEKIFAVLNIRR